jgi:cell division protein ZapE
MRVVNLDHGTDYRLSKLPAKDRYFYPLNDKTKSNFDRAATRLIPDGSPSLILDLNGRQMTIDRHHNASGATDFSNLCDNPYGTADYDRLADRLRLLFLDEVPILSRHEKNRTRRLIHLVDVFYDRGRRIIPRADAPPSGLLADGPLIGEFKRTASRLESWRRMDEYDGAKTGLSE